MKIYNDITLVIPAKKEKDSLPIVIRELKKYHIKKIIVIPMQENYSQIKDSNTIFVKQKKNGYGNALTLGINKVKTKYFCIFNADGSFNPIEIKNMHKSLKKNNLDFVFGSRYEQKGKTDDDTLLTAIGNFFFTKISTLFFSTKISDILYTFVLGRVDRFKKLKIKSNDFSFCVELPIKIEKKNMKYLCLPAHERKRLFGIKKVNEFRDGVKILLKMIYLYFKKI